MKDFSSGILSGMIAAVSTLPLTFWRDYALASSRMNAGVLTMPNTLELMSTMHQYTKQVGLTQAGKDLGRKMMVQAPFRMVLVGGIFGTMALMQQVIDEKPPACILDVVKPNPKPRFVFGASIIPEETLPMIPQRVFEPGLRHHYSRGSFFPLSQPVLYPKQRSVFGASIIPEETLPMTPQRVFEPGLRHHYPRGSFFPLSQPVPSDNNPRTTWTKLFVK